ncbi:hypothetical protein NMG60_11031418 [Bertholletia excelsa]
MVTFHTLLSPTHIAASKLDNSSKKRKWEEAEAQMVLEKPLIKTESKRSVLNTQLQLEPQLPLDWQRCLDIKSGEIHFYNTRTQVKTLKDPRTSPEPSSPSSHMRLDLELNLPCGRENDLRKHDAANNSGNPFPGCHKNAKNSIEMTRYPSWLACEEDQREMVAAVCKKCHMLVMMFKSTPACPNCKFLHPPDQSHSGLFNRSLSLLC